MPWEDIVDVLRAGVSRQYRIDIETDSTIRGDVTRRQQEIGTFMQGAAQFFQAFAPAVEMGAMPLDVAVDIFTGCARVPKLGKQVEDALARWGQHAAEEAKNPKPQQPDPEMLKVQALQQQTQQDGQLKSAAMQQDGQIKTQKMESDAQLRREQMAMDREMRMQELQNNVEIAVHRMNFEKEKHANEMDLARDQAFDDASQAHEEMHLKNDVAHAQVHAKAQSAAAKDGKPSTGSAVARQGPGTTGGQIKKQLNDIVEVLDHLMKAHKAPKLIVHDAAGKAAGVQFTVDGKTYTRPVQRDASGRPVGLEPIH